MILRKYILSKFFTYFFLTSTFFVLLFNLIEFFEKVARVNASLGTILTFIALNLIPSFFSVLPLATWLATCLLIRDLYQHNEWESLYLLGISPRACLTLLMSAGIALSALSFFGKEFLFFGAMNKPEAFKRIHLKHQSPQKLYNQWFVLEEGTFAHITFLDLAQSYGEGLRIVSMTNKFQMNHHIISPTFNLDTKNHTLLIPKGTRFSFKRNAHIPLTDYHLKLPTLFAQLEMYTQSPSLFHLARTLITSHHLFTPATFQKELSLLLSRVLDHIQPFLYAILTFVLFFFLAPPQTLSWLLAISSFPVCLTVISFCQFLIAHGFSAWCILIPYIFMALLFLLLRRRMPAI